MEPDYTEIRSVIGARCHGRFTATPRRPSPVSHFTIGRGFPRLAAAGIASIILRDLRVDNISQLAIHDMPQSFDAELFSDLAEPVRLTLPHIGCDGRIELVLFNESNFPASIVVRFYWAKAQHD
jgi:hypothetical protein